MAFPYLLLAAQAAGIGVNLYGSAQQNRIESAGYNINEDQLRLRMDQEQLAFQQESLQSLTMLKETLASQRAILGARGQNPGQGTAKAIEQNSVRKQSVDQQAREINARFKKSYLESMARFSRVEQQGSRAQRGTQLLGQSLNMVDFNTLFGNVLNKKGEKKPSKSMT